jgi:hypothetical protein
MASLDILHGFRLPISSVGYSIIPESKLSSMMRDARELGWAMEMTRCERRIWKMIGGQEIYPCLERAEIRTCHEMRGRGG